MAIALLIFCVSFAAFCVWLTVRIVNRRERWAKRTAAILAVVAIAYPLSIGPFVWLEEGGYLSAGVADSVALAYRPIEWSIDNGPPWIDELAQWYLGFWDVNARN